MRHSQRAIFLFVIVFAMMGVAVIVPTIALAQGPWDQVLGPARRFVLVMVGGTAVLDNETGLVWDRSPSSMKVVWDEAHDQCNGMALGGRKGWRLPTIQELASLVDPRQSDPALPASSREGAGHPFINVQTTDVYWSANLTRINTAFAWAVSFLDGAVVNSLINNTNFFWCVRGAKGVDIQ